jgi:hypothetical protein
LYSCVIVGRIEVREHLRAGAEPDQLRLVEPRDPQDLLQISDAAFALCEAVLNEPVHAPVVTRDEGFRPTGTANPRGVMPGDQGDEPAHHGDFEKGEIAGDDEDPLGMSDGERGMQPAESTAPGHDVRVNRHVEIGKSTVSRPDDEDLAGDLLQNVELAGDDGAAADDEPAFVQAAEPARMTARENRGGRVGMCHAH